MLSPAVSRRAGLFYGKNRRPVAGFFRDNFYNILILYITKKNKTGNVAVFCLPGDKIPPRKKETLER